jgi:phosphate-selective porin
MNRKPPHRVTRRTSILRRTLLPVALLVPAAWMGLATPARASVTLVDNDKVKIDMEMRLMMWATYTGPDLIPGVNSAPPPPQDENIEDFFVRRARLLLRARLSDSLDIVFQMGQDTLGSKVLRDDAGFRFKDAAINYRKNDALQVIVGQFKVPFLRQNLASGFNQLLVDRSFVTGLRPGVEASRDEGGQIWGNAGGLQYRVGVFDGSDQEDTNTNSSLRGAARVSYNWFTKETGFGYTGTTIGDKKILQIGGQADAQNGRTDARDDPGFTTQARAYRAWAADIYYDQPFASRWALTTEGAWVERRDDYDAVGLATKSTAAGYAQAGLLLPWNVGPGRLQIAGRWEEIQTDRGGVDASTRARTLGLNWYAKGHDRKIQFDHGTVTERPTDLDDNFYRLSVVATF